MVTKDGIVPGGLTAIPLGERALDTQVAGKHYKDMAIQPIVFCQKNKLNACETHAIGYICRHQKDGGAEDIRKAIHMLEILLELEYSSDKVVFTNCTVGDKHGSLVSRDPVGEYDDKPWLKQPDKER